MKLTCFFSQRLDMHKSFVYLHAKKGLIVHCECESGRTKKNIVIAWSEKYKNVRVYIWQLLLLGHICTALQSSSCSDYPRSTKSKLRKLHHAGQCKNNTCLHTRTRKDKLDYSYRIYKPSSCLTEWYVEFKSLVFAQTSSIHKQFLVLGMFPLI